MGFFKLIVERSLDGDETSIGWQDSAKFLAEGRQQKSSR